MSKMTDRHLTGDWAFRPHRGGFDASMPLSVLNPTFDTIREITLKDMILKVDFEIKDISITPCGFDERNSWQTYRIVLFGNVVGFLGRIMSKGDFEELKKRVDKIRVGGLKLPVQTTEYKGD